MTRSLIQFKVVAIADGVAVHHDLGIIDTPINALFSYPELHPDLVDAAMTSIRTMARKYNGASDESEVEQNADGQKCQEQHDETAKVFPEGASGHADEEAGQVK